MSKVRIKMSVNIGWIDAEALQIQDWEKFKENEEVSVAEEVADVLCSRNWAVRIDSGTRTTSRHREEPQVAAQEDVPAKKK